jgi:hypothetical protein
MRYSVRHKSGYDEIDHIQFEVSEIPSQQVVLIGAGILFAEGADDGTWCVYDETNTPLPQGEHVAGNYRDEPDLRASKPTEFFDVGF